MILPKMKFRFIRAMIVNGMKHARRRSAHAKFIKYRLFVNRMGPREPNMTMSAAVLPINATRKITMVSPLITHSASLMFEEFEDNTRDAFRLITDRQNPVAIVQKTNRSEWRRLI